jgi:hypothetical protein
MPINTVLFQAPVPVEDLSHSLSLPPALLHRSSFEKNPDLGIMMFLLQNVN